MRTLSEGATRPLSAPCMNGNRAGVASQEAMCVYFSRENWTSMLNKNRMTRPSEVLPPRWCRWAARQRIRLKLFKITKVILNSNALPI